MATTTKNDGKSERRDRAIVSLPDDVAAQLDQLRKRAGEKLREQIGVTVEPKRSDMVAALIQQAHDEQHTPAA